MTGQAGDTPFWESPEAVKRFANRDPDVRLLGLLDEYVEPGRVRILDLGCAAGRNTVVLAERGFDVLAVDSSVAMVKRTRQRVGAILGGSDAERRVLVGSMDELSFLSDGSVNMVVALGVLHQAGSRIQWLRAVTEIARVLRDGGLFLCAVWSPRTRPDGHPLEEVPDEEHVYFGFHSGRHFLLEADDLDLEMARHGLKVAAPTEVVKVDTETGLRVTINGLYRRVYS
jgi:SAM-dependent methyltransferase